MLQASASVMFAWLCTCKLSLNSWQLLCIVLDMVCFTLSLQPCPTFCASGFPALAEDGGTLNCRNYMKRYLIGMKYMTTFPFSLRLLILLMGLISIKLVSRPKKVSIPRKIICHSTMYLAIHTTRISYRP